MAIKNVDTENFLANYWQKKPLLIRNAFPDFINPLTPNELAGLACEDEIESRLVIENNNEWQLEHGPLSETTFTTVPKSHWTLLVQAVDHWVPEVQSLLNQFRFIPSWRIDDVMVSYATKGGSVGPHYDNYDVFLLQGAGQRRWQVGPRYNSESPRQDNDQLLLLENFCKEQEWLLEPGDLLYLPPQYGHWGIAEDDDCMTYSVGFRAPSHAEILADFCDDQLAKLSPEERYADPANPAQSNSGEITALAISRIQQILTNQINDTEALTEWFGRFVTQPKYESPEHPSLDYAPEQLSDILKGGYPLFSDPTARIAYTETANAHYLYLNGHSYRCESLAAKVLSARLANPVLYPIDNIETLITDDESFSLLLSLLNQGALYFEQDV